MRTQCLQNGCLGMKLVLRFRRPWIFCRCLYDNAWKFRVLPYAGCRAEREFVLSFVWIVLLWSAVCCIISDTHHEIGFVQGLSFLPLVKCKVVMTWTAIRIDTCDTKFDPCQQIFRVHPGSLVISPSSAGFPSGALLNEASVKERFLQTIPSTDQNPTENCTCTLENALYNIYCRNIANVHLSDKNVLNYYTPHHSLRAGIQLSFDCDFDPCETDSFK